MVGNPIMNNVVTISGKIISKPEFSHEVYGEGFYYFLMEVPRLSNSSDKIPITVSERLVPKEKLKVGRFVDIEGQFRSYNNYGDKGNKLILTVFAREITFVEEQQGNKNPNHIFLNGFICKEPIYRTTPFGREICDVLLAVNRSYNKSDYIPCIAWGRNARYSKNLETGDNVKIWGRIQSRDYQKKLENGEVIEKTAFEISISKMEISQRENEETDICEDNIEENEIEWED